MYSTSAEHVGLRGVQEKSVGVHRDGVKLAGLKVLHRGHWSL